MEQEQIIDTTNIYCKTCLSTTDLEYIDLESMDASGTRILRDMVLSLCPSVLQSNADSVNTICKECHERLEQAFVFQQQILEADDQLRRALLSNPVGYEVVEQIDEEMYDLIKEEHIDEQQEDVEVAVEEIEEDFVKDEDFDVAENASEDELLERLCMSFQKPKDYTTPDGTKVVYVKNLKHFQCLTCNVVIARRDKALTHLKICEGEIDGEILEGIMDEKTPKVSPKIKKEKKILETYNCEECSKTFANQITLRNHMKRHTGDLPFPCPCCTLAFAYKLVLERHMRSHTGERKFICSECNKGFATKSGMESHQRLHTGNLPFGCDLCLKRFNSKSNLKIHFRKHTGEKPYSCIHCVKSFAGSNDLAKHMRKHLGELMYPCQLCDEKFRTQVEVRRHMIVHASGNTEEIIVEEHLVSS